MSVALSELEQPHDRYLARSSQWATTADWAPYGKQFTEDGLYVEHSRGSYQEHLRGLVAMTAVAGGFNAKQDQP